MSQKKGVQHSYFSIDAIDVGPICITINGLLLHDHGVVGQS